MYRLMIVVSGDDPPEAGLEWIAQQVLMPVIGCAAQLMQQQIVYTALQDVECNFGHEIFFVECWINHGDFDATNFVILHEAGH